jgi:hypothetical protein
MDDFIQRKDRRVQADAAKSVSFEEWESNQESGDGSFGKSKKQAPPPQVLGANLLKICASSFVTLTNTNLG